MDLIDKKIICELDLNARTPLTLLAKRLKVNRNVIDYRIKKLEENNIITKYICSLNLGLLGFKTYKVYLKINPSESHESLLKTIKNHKNIIHCLKLEGTFDYSLAIAVKNIIELDNILMELKQQFPKIIKEYTVSIVVYSKIFKLHKLLLGQTKELPKIEKYSLEEKKITLDKKDLLILKTLSQHANLPLTILAQKTNLSLDIVKYRIKELSKQLITSYRITFDIVKIGYYHYLILLRIKQATKQDEQKLVTWCALKNNILYCTKRIGNFDFEINVAITDIQDLNKFLSELKKEFGHILESYETNLATSLLKLDYVPL